jgi:hypothetical protein
MSKLRLTLTLIFLTFLWGGVGYDMGQADASGRPYEPSNGDLFGFFIAIVFTVAFGVAVWREMNDGKGPT